MDKGSLYIPVLNKKFAVGHSNKAIKLSYKFQLAMAKAGDIAETDDVTQQFEKAVAYSDVLVDFPSQILKLTDKQKDKLDDMDQLDLQDLDVRLALTIQGVDKRGIDETVKSMHQPVVDDDSKSDAGDEKASD